MILGGECVDGQGDIVFVVDNSGSIRDNNPADGSYDNWNLMLEFMAGFVQQLNIGPDNFKVGLVR